MPAGHPDSAAFLDLAPCALIELDPDETIRFVNPYFERLTGRSAASLRGARFGSLLTPASRLLLQAKLTQELALGGHLEEIALDVRTSDGVRIPVMLNATQPLAANGVPGVIRLAMWRAAGRRAYEAEVPKARLAAEEAAQAKADFLANVSHEIRTPLNAILGSAGLLERTSLEASQREMLEMIESAGRMLERMVSDVLEISKVQAGALSLNVQPFVLLAELRGVLDEARLQAERKGLQFRVDAESALDGVFLGDPVRLKQILGALLSNAVKFTETGEIRVRLQWSAEGVGIEVADTGVGFDEAHAASLFQGFTQAEGGLTRRFGGAGLGLSLCKGLVDLMHGEISAESKSGVGSIFRIRVPLERGADVFPAPSPAHEQVLPQGGRLQVLYVEDNPTNQRVVQMILEAYDVGLELADNGELGIAAWRRGGFDMVLMDLQMPVMDGLTAIREIRRLETADLRPSRTPIVVLSANAMEHHRREALEAGADLHVAKPISPQRLIQAIEAALAATGDRTAA